MEKLTATVPALDRVDRGDVVSVVRLHGVITSTTTPLPRGVLNLQTIESAVKKAFEHDRLKAVALAINSPGGMPTQSALIAERVRELAEEKNVPVFAFCEDVTASGGYWIACAADEIYAHRTSMVGSVGVISAGFGLRGLIDKLGIERRVHTAGENKHRLDPFEDEKPEDVAWLERMQSRLHEQFTDWVRQRRGPKLSGEEELFNGDVWDGASAARLGLTDGVGSLREVMNRRYPDAKLVVAEPHKPLLARLGIAMPGVALGYAVMTALDAFEQRAAWSRFGL